MLESDYNKLKQRQERNACICVRSKCCERKLMYLIYVNITWSRQKAMSLSNLSRINRLQKSSLWLVIKTGRMIDWSTLNQKKCFISGYSFYSDLKLVNGIGSRRWRYRESHHRKVMSRFKLRAVTRSILPLVLRFECEIAEDRKPIAAYSHFQFFYLYCKNAKRHHSCCVVV